MRKPERSLFLNRSPELIIASAIALLIGMTLHEFAHNYVAYRMGDPEPARQGRLTLNPLVHINWIGWLMFVFIGFGILGSAPISPYRMPATNRRWRWLAAVAAGPLTNLLVAIVFAIIIRIIGLNVLAGMPSLVSTTLLVIVNLNLLLFIFNLIPLFPLDGWNIALALLPPDAAYKWQQWQQTTYYIFIGILLISFVRIPGIPNILGILVSTPVSTLMNLLVFG